MIDDGNDFHQINSVIDALLTIQDNINITARLKCFLYFYFQLL